MTAREARLAMRCHNQRLALRDADKVRGYSTFPVQLKRMYSKLLQDREKELRELRSRPRFWEWLVFRQGEKV